MKRFLVFFLVLALMNFSGCQLPEKVGIPETEESQWAQTVPESLQARETEVHTEPAPEPSEAALQWPEPDDETLVRVIDYLPTIRQELAYATDYNFTGQRIYGFSDAYLRYGTVKKLGSVLEELAQQGLGLKIWDGFRPVSAQFKLWQVCPDPTYVADPTAGFSSHSRGNTVDLTLVDQDGNTVEMPSGFDEFSVLADRDYSDCSETAAANARLLQDIMEKHGFSGYFGEWWHYSDQQSYPVEESFEPVPVSWWYADCEEFISLRAKPDTSAEVITRIPVNGEFQMLALDGDFALVDYQGMRGYVLRSFTQPVDGASDRRITPS